MFKGDFHLVMEITDFGLVRAKLLWLQKLGTFAQKIAGQGVGDEFAGFRDSVQCHERPKSRPRLSPSGTR